MPNDSPGRLHALFSAALERPPHERMRFLQEACADDTALLSEVASLLAAYDRVEGFAGAGTDEDDDLLGATVGAYRIRRLIGQGGMGKVYLASRNDGAFDLDVAVKIVNPLTADDYVLARFEEECRMLAPLQHPNIARLLDAGRTADRRSYVVLEYVDGLPLTTYCERHHLPWTARLALLRKVCDAVSFAHRHLIVHRDLKPLNILVDADGNPKLLDFGIAKAVTRSGLEGSDPTHPLNRRATPAYASPEQKRGEAAHTGMDVFALGVILHQLVTGFHPEPFGAEESTTDDPREYENPSALVARRAVAGDPSLDVPYALAADLDAIVLKALAGDPRKRYASVEALSRDLQAVMESRPVGARSGTLPYRAARFVRRNRALTAATAIAVLSTVGVIASLGYLWQRASAERAAAVRRFDQLGVLAASLFDVDEALARVPGTTSARDRLNRSLASYLAGLRESAGGDARVLLQVAESYRRLGDVQGNPHNPNLGDVGRALASYAAALEILEELRGRAPGDRGLVLVLAATLAGRADVLAATGQPDAALRDYQQALALASGGAAADDTPPVGAELQARIHRSLGDAAFARGDHEAARASYEQALRVERALSLRLGDTPERRRLMALSRLRSAAVMERQQAWTEAHEHYDAAIGALRSLNASEPATAGLLRDTAVALTRFAALIRPSDEAGAQARVKEAIDILRPLVEKDAADARARRDLSRALLQYGDLVSASDRVQAQASYREAREQAEMLRAAAGEDAQLESELGVIRARIASGGGPPRATLRLFTVASGRREPLAEKGRQPLPVTQSIIAAASAPAGWSRYLIVFGAEGKADVWDESRSAGGEWTLPIAGPPPAQTFLLLALPRPLSPAEREALVAEISAVPGPRAVDFDSQILWTSDADDTILSTASPRGAPDLDWMRAVRGKLERLADAKFAGHTFPIAPRR